MGKLIPFPERGPQQPSPEDARQAPVWHIDSRERLRSAQQDIHLRAFYELQRVGFTEQLLDEKIIDALDGYPPKAMLHDLRDEYKLNEIEARAVMDNCDRAVCESFGIEYIDEQA